MTDKKTELRKQAEEIVRGKAAQSQENIESLSLEETRQTLHDLRVHQIELEIQNEELRRTQMELEAARARYFDLYDLAPVGYVTLSEKGLILEANLTAATMLGVTRSNLLEQPFSRIIPKEDQDIYYQYRKQLFETYSPSSLRLGAGETVHPVAPQVRELRMLKKDGTQFWAHLEATVTHDPSTNTGRDVEGASVCRVTISDVTIRKRMEEELLRAHKLESLGVLAGGIAHDFNNLMAIVQGYIDLALMDLPLAHVSRQRLLNAMQGIDKTKDLTSRLITFSRGGGPLREIFDLKELIRDTVNNTIKGTEVRVKFDFMENLWPAEADELQMKQVFCNLTKNVVEAMPEGGNLTVQAENVLIQAGDVLDLKEGSYLKITFADEGIGIFEELLSKVFDPYFTTKKMGARNGLGLGLTVCYSVLKNHDGHITVHSLPGKGASFVLYLPAQPELGADLAKGINVKEVKKTVSAGMVRVLIMDDEHHIRVIERAYLERMGYEVTDVKDGQEAIDTYRKALKSGTPFDLVMLDLTVRQGLGGQLAMEQLLKKDPSVKAIIASGYVDDPVIENYADYGFKGALTKPFKRENMEYLVEKILRG
ncbi:MAG: ATP-binding protein [Syntrophus sp. (in: bacteria)]